MRIIAQAMRTDQMAGGKRLRRLFLVPGMQASCKFDDGALMLLSVLLMALIHLPVASRIRCFAESRMGRLSPRNLE